MVAHPPRSRPGSARVERRFGSHADSTVGTHIDMQFDMGAAVCASQATGTLFPVAGDAAVGRRRWRRRRMERDMAGTRRRAARAALAAGALVMLVAGCSGGDGDTQSFKVDSPGAGADANTVFNGALLRATEICGQEDPPHIVRWEFASRDRESLVAQQYVNEKFPTFIDCTSIQVSPGDATGASSMPALPGAQARTAPGSATTAKP